MVEAADFETFSDADLIDAYVGVVQKSQATEHIGAANRLADRGNAIIAELRLRDPDLKLLRHLLDHSDLNVRFSAAHEFRLVDRGIFESALATLAARDDETGRRAQTSLETDAWMRNAEASATPHLSGLPPQYQWQCANPPPAAVTFAEIGDRLRKDLPDAFIGRLLKLVRPAIGLWPHRSDGILDPAASRFGGSPLVPHDFDWPMTDDEPMLFIGQINCAELAGLPGAELLPESGLLAFFGDHDSVKGSLGTGGGGAVFYWPESRELVAADTDPQPLEVFPVCGLAFRPLIDLPDVHSGTVAKILSDEETLGRYRAIREATRNHGIPEEVRDYCCHSKLLGWPTLVQWHDLMEMYGGLGSLKLLAQFDPYSNGEDAEGWGSGGSLYFVMADRELKHRRFERCDFDMQCA